MKTSALPVMLSDYTVHSIIVMFSPYVRVPAIIKVHGAHLKASAAMVRLRLYDILALLPPKTYEGNTFARARISFHSSKEHSEGVKCLCVLL